MKHLVRLAIAACSLHAAAAAESAAWQPLLDTSLSKFDVFLSYRGDQIMSVLDGTAPADLEPLGLNPPGQTVMTVIEQDGKPVLRITGEWYGCLVTKDEYTNFHFRAQFKWGDKKWEPRLTEPKDSGVLYFSRGDFGVDYWKSWALSQEFQVIEHGIGEYWTQATSSFDIRADPKKDGEAAPRWNSKATAWQQFVAPRNHVLAGSDQDKPGDWNTLEIVCYEGDCVHIVNGKVVMALANSRFRQGSGFTALRSGKFQIQSEAAEVFYRGIEIQPLDTMPKKYRKLFKWS